MIMKDLCIFHSMFTLEYLSRYLFSFTFDSEMIHALLAIMLLHVIDEHCPCFLSYSF
jgi:hypothetical protein